MSDIIVFGGGGHALVVIDAIEASKQHQVVGVVDPGLKIGSQVAGYKVVSDEAYSQATGVRRGIVAIGDSRRRKIVVQNILKTCQDFEFVTVVHPAATVAKTATVHKGSVVMAGAVINPSCEIGEHCVVNTRASLDHENRLGNFVSISPGVTSGGRVEFGEGCFVGLGVNIIQGISVGEYSLIGAGSLVLKDIPKSVKAFGVPSKVIPKTASFEEK